MERHGDRLQMHWGGNEGKGLVWGGTWTMVKVASEFSQRGCVDCIDRGQYNYGRYSTKETIVYKYVYGM